MKSRRTKACEIKPDVKTRVYERDGHKCVWCGKYVDKSCACAHFIPRSHGGLGIDENILTLCSSCHSEFDNGNHRNEMKTVFERYLKSYYGVLNSDNLIYDKWKGVFK